jgi:hypothetical protein
MDKYGQLILGQLIRFLGQLIRFLGQLILLGFFIR